MNRLIHQKKIYEAGIHEFQTYSNMDFINPPLQTLVLSNGNIGIGTNVPMSKLDVRGNIRCSNISVIGDFVTLNTITSNTEQIVIENAGTGPALKVTQTGNNSVAEFYDKESGVALFVGNGGNIGIGTTVPMAKLDVSGSIYALNQIYTPNRVLAYVYKKNNDSSYYNDGTIGNIIMFSGIVYNVGNAWNPSNGRFTAPYTGYYNIDCHMVTDSSTSGTPIRGDFRIIKNSVYNPSALSPIPIGYGFFTGNDYKGTNASGVWFLNVGDYLNIYNVAGSGVTQNFYGDENTGNMYSHIRIYLLG